MTQARRLLLLSEAKSPLSVGVVLGEATIHAGLIDEQGGPVSWLDLATEIEAGPEAVAGRIGAAVRQVIQGAGVKPSAVVRVGLGLPGVIDAAAGTLLDAVRLRPWERFPLADRVGHFCGLPVTLVNDADAAAYGEFRLGAGRPFRSMVLLTLGTGVGSGIVIGDLAAKGRFIQGSECGHMVICCAENARQCGCGQRGHLEAYASASAVFQRTREALRAGRTSSLSKRLAAGELLSPNLVTAEAAAGDPLALEIVLDTARYLAVGVVSVMHTVDPNGVLLGGKMTFGGPESELGRRFLARVRDEVGRRAFPLLAERTAIEFAALGGDAAVLGAAGLARLHGSD
jgi:glucokinase